MEHIVQFGISIDDEMIRKRLEDYAYDDILKTLKEQWENDMPKKMNWKSNRSEIDWSEITSKVVYDLCIPYKDTIIEKAAQKLCDSFKRTKVFKERMTEETEA